MKMRNIFIISALSASLFLASCGQASNTTEDTSTSDSSSASETETVTLKAENFDSEDDFWDYVTEEYTTDFQRVRDGEMSRKYVVVDGVVASCDKINDYKWDLIIGYEMGDGSYNFFDETYSSSMSKLDYGEELLDSLTTDDFIQICAFMVGGDSIDLDDAVGIRIIDHQDGFVQSCIDSQSSDDESESSNPLMNIEIQHATVMSGDGQNELGERGYISISKSDMEEITSDQYIEFAESAVQDSGYNWFTIFFDDGTGIEFAGCYINLADYGTLDDAGCIVDWIGSISISDGTATYEENE